LNPRQTATVLIKPIKCDEAFFISHLIQIAFSQLLPAPRDFNCLKSS